MQEIINKLKEHMRDEKNNQRVAVAFASGAFEALIELEQGNTYTTQEVCQLLNLLYSYGERG